MQLLCRVGLCFGGWYGRFTGFGWWLPHIWVSRLWLFIFYFNGFLRLSMFSFYILFSLLRFMIWVFVWGYFGKVMHGFGSISPNRICWVRAVMKDFTEAWVIILRGFDEVCSISVTLFSDACSVLVSALLLMSWHEDGKKLGIQEWWRESAENLNNNLLRIRWGMLCISHSVFLSLLCSWFRASAHELAWV